MISLNIFGYSLTFLGSRPSSRREYPYRILLVNGTRETAELAPYVFVFYMYFLALSVLTFASITPSTIVISRVYSRILLY